MSSRKITFTFLDLKRARTIGWGLHYVRSQLGIWGGRSDVDVKYLLEHGLDKTKFDTSNVWIKGKKTKRLYLAGHTVANQIDKAMTELAGEGTDDVMIDFDQLEKKVSFRIYENTKEEQSEADFRATVIYNMRPKWFNSQNDSNFYTGYLNDFNFGLFANLLNFPILPSTTSKVFKQGFDINMEVPN